jgi:hypothetical protein
MPKRKISLLPYFLTSLLSVLKEAQVLDWDVSPLNPLRVKLDIEN